MSDNLDTTGEAVATHLLLRAFCDELARCGLAGAVTSPGSRSTPIALTLAAHAAIPTWSHIDERSGAFFALGVAKATGRPAALACTSGTAAANYLPALMEAREARVPLIVLTADRPPELREVGAGQVIDQVKLYGTAAKWFVDVGTHSADPGRLRWIRQLACRAFWTSLEGRPGVVHLNWALREPLVLAAELPPDPPGGEGRPERRPWVSRPPLTTDPAAAAETLLPVIRAAENGVVVVGRHERRRPALGPAVAAFAEASGWPALAEPLSGARRGGLAVAHYDALLRAPAFATASRPTAVLRVGDLPTGKPLREWLAGAEAIQVALDAEGAWADPAAALDLSVAAEPAAVLGILAELLRGPAAVSPYLAAWLQADLLAAQAIDATLGEHLSEPRVAVELGAGLPPEATLVVSASMPIRDVETFFGLRDDPPRVLSNRGANGIDGVLSTAFGVAAGSAGPVVALIGDVALAYDIGALVSARRLRLALTIVLIDNEGGGIFDFLPVAETRPSDRYEVHVATPTQLDFADVAAAFGLSYAPATTVPELREALAAAVAGDGVTLVHVHTDRAHNVRLHRQVWAAVERALAP